MLQHLIFSVGKMLFSIKDVNIVEKAYFTSKAILLYIVE
jgi:hypothetical protein